MELDIRTCEPDDLDELMQLYKHLHVKDTPVPSSATLELVWRDILNDPKILCLIGEYSGIFVASCILAIIPNLTRATRPYGLIENVVTHSAYRRKGFGTSILRHALNTAWQHNCYKVMLLTGRQDEGVYRFYEGAGFKRGIKTGFIATPNPHSY